jgi:serine/threonine protein kinase
MCLVSEECGEPLTQYYKSTSFNQKDEFARIGKEILAALVYLHKNDVAHNNLKTENVISFFPTPPSTYSLSSAS